MESSNDEVEDFMKLIAFEADEIIHAFKKARIEGRGTSQEISDRREEAVKSFIQKYFPFPYRVAKGNIIDSFNRRSQSIDVILLNPCHPYTTNNINQYSLILADGVDVAIEVKPNLATTSEIVRGLNQIISVKKLRKRKVGLRSIKNSSMYPNAMLSGRQIPSIIFGTSTFTSPEKLIRVVGNFYIENKIDRFYRFDMIVILNRGILFNAFSDSNVDFGKDNEGIFWAELGEKTLATMLLFMNSWPQSELRMGEPVLNYYIKHSVDKAIKIDEINQLLNLLDGRDNNQWDILAKE